MSKVKKWVVLFIALLPVVASGQNIGLGGDIMYNFQSEGLGLGARVSFFPNKRVSFVPEFSYYFQFNKVNEYYAGMAIELKVLQGRKAYFYVLGHGAYNRWLNYQESPMIDPAQSNWDAEFGGGISTFWCLRPFIEYRYNFNFKETHLRLGLLYVFGCNDKGGKGGPGGNYSGASRSRGKISRGRFQPCAAYD